ncbi:MAG: FGGY-family carbohydrate kinase [Spirochaetaceae bacterium]|jgi:sugar (pentulose or hexulose) kinase|nr:FGGY-family carbohydrate kinase [Spirochaetaceae bacterium]
MTPVFFCADIGTSSLKAALIDSDGRDRGFSREVYPPDRFAQGAIRAADWELALSRAAGRLLKTGVKPEGVCISGNGPTLVPVTPEDEALPPLHWYDAVIPPESDETGPAERLAARAALPKPKSFFLPHAEWFLRRRPEEYEKTRLLFSAQEWLSFRLGAEAVTTLPAAAYVPYYWDAEQCSEAGLAMEKFPPFVNLGSVIGRVSPEAADRYGLPPGIPIIAGGPDFIMALLGVGAIKPGRVCDRAGTSEGINLCTSGYIRSRELRALPHVEAGLWNIGGVIADSGRLFEQYRTLTGQEQRSYEETLSELIAPDGTLPPDKADFFPRFGFFGRGIMNRVSLGRGALETLGFQARSVLDAFAGQGFSVTEMRVSGGQGKNALWNRLKADITGCTLLIPEISDGELAGDAALAAIALGEASGFAEAADRMIRIKSRYSPDPQRRLRYTEAYRAYCERRDLLDKVFGA